MEKSNVPYDTISRASFATQSVFSKCCFCVPIRLGCFVLGYINLTISILQTLGLLALTTFIGVTTHGFDHFDSDTFDKDPDSPTISNIANDKAIPSQIGVLLVLLLVANIAWLAIHIACLVGLHKKRPGPIRVYVGFASARLILAMVGFIYLIMTNRTTAHTIIGHSIGIGLTAYFILVYYIYAVQLERERQAETQAPANKEFIYPIKLDKSHLVV